MRGRQIDHGLLKLPDDEHLLEVPQHLVCGWLHLNPPFRDIKAADLPSPYQLCSGRSLRYGSPCNHTAQMGSIVSGGEKIAQHLSTIGNFSGRSSDGIIAEVGARKGLLRRRGAISVIGSAGDPNPARLA